MNQNTRILLREWITLLLEAPGDDGEMALYCQGDGDMNEYLFYEPRIIFNRITGPFYDRLCDQLEEYGGDHKSCNPEGLLQEIALSRDTVEAAAIAMINTAFGMGPYRQAELAASRPRQGLGNMLYGFIMKVEAPMVPSRVSLSDDALQFWYRQYQAGRGTPLPKKYEYSFYNIPNMPWLDYSYNGIPSAWEIKPLLAAHKSAINTATYIYNDIIDDLGFPREYRIASRRIEMVILDILRDDSFSLRYDPAGDILRFRDDADREFTGFPVGDAAVEERRRQRETQPAAPTGPSGPDERLSNASPTS